MNTSNSSNSFNGRVDHALTHYALVAVLVALIAYVLRARSRTRELTPPSVPGHWLFKNQKLLEAPWRGVLLADKYKPQYGDIFQLSTPFKTVVVLNSLQAVSEVLEKQSAVTSDRPRNVMLFEMCGFGRTVGFRNHDELQRKYRRVMASSLHPAAARSYADLHTAASAFFLRDLVDRLSALSSKNHLVIEPNHSVPMAASIQDAIGRFIMRMTYGHIVVENDPLLAMVKRQAEFLLTGFAKHYWVNDIPILRYIPKWFPGAGFVRDAAYRREQRAIVNAREPFAAVLADVNQGTVERPSYSSKLLEQKGGANASEEDIDLVKWTAQPMFAAGSTTVSGFEVSALIAESDSGLQTVALVHSFLFTMCIRPEIAARVQAEIDAQVGRDRLPTLHDRDSLPFTDAVLQEVIRCNPVFAFGLEHCATEDLQVRGYTIKKGTTIEANIWALMREPTTYPDPHTFNPDRFLKKVPDTDPRRFLFGFGRRVCPGQHVANNGAFTMCASFMSVFNITAGEDTMREVAHCGRDLWKMFTPFGPFEPKPFACTIRPRDQAALAILEACKETEIIN